MQTEFEAKFYPVDKDKFRNLLKSLGATLVEPERLLRRAIIDREFNPDLKCGFIRVRDEGGGQIRLSAKTQASAKGSISDQKEVDVLVSDYDKTLQIIELMGYIPDSYIETTRETWDLFGAEVVIDTWPGLDPFAEIEADSEEAVRTICQSLGFDWSKKIITATVEMYSEIYKLPIPEVLSRFKHLTFKDNPFASLPRSAIINTQSV